MANQLSIEFLHDSLREYFAGEWLHQPAAPYWLNRLDERLGSYHSWAEPMYLMSGLLKEGALTQLARWCSDWRNNPYGLDHLAEHLYQLAIAHPDTDKQEEFRQKLYNLISDDTYLDRKSYVIKAVSPVLSDIHLALNLALEEDDIVKITRFGRCYVQRKESSKREIEKIPEWIAEDDYERALDIVRLLHQDNVKFVGLLWIARLILDKGDSDKAKQIISEALEIARVEYAGDLEPIVLYALEGLIDAGMVDEAAEVIRRRGSDGLARVSGSYAELICKIETAEEAGKLLKIALKLMAGLEATDRADALKGFLHEIAEGKHAWCEVVPLQVIGICDRIVVPLAKIKAWGWVASALTRLGDIEHANTIFAQALDRVEGIEQEENKYEAYKSIALAFAQTGQFERTKQIVESIVDREAHDETLSLIASTLAQAGAFQDALQMTKRIEVPLAKSKTLTTIALALAKAGYKYQAIFAQALQTAREISSIPVRSEALREIAISFSQAKEFDGALQIVEGIEDNSVKIEALSVIAAALSKVGNESQAKAVFNHALQKAREIPGASFKIEAFRTIALALGQAGKSDDALQVVENIEDASSKIETLKEISSALAQTGNFAQALQMNAGFGGDSVMSESLHGIASSFAKMGEFAQVLQVADEIAQESSITESLKEIALALAQKREFDRSLQLADEIEDGLVKSQVLGLIYVALVNASEHQYAQKVLTEVRHIAMENPDIKDAVFSTIASVLTQAEEFDQALQIAEEIGTPTVKAEALNTIASALAQAGDDSQAKEVFFQILQLALFR